MPISANGNQQGNSRIAIIGGLSALALVALLIGRLSLSRSEAPQQSEQSSASPEIATNDNQTASNIINRLREGQANAASRDQTQEETNEEDVPSLRERFDRARSMAGTAEKRKILLSIAKELAIDSPESAREYVEELLAGPKSQQDDAIAFIKEFMNQYSAIDPKAALDWAAFLPDEARLEAYHDGMKNWLRSDTQGAIELVESLNLGPQRSDLMNIVVGHIETMDIEGGAHWAEHLATNPDIHPHMNVVGRVWSRSNITSAHEFGAAIQDPAQQSEFYSGITQTLIEAGPALAKEWIDRFPQENGIQQQAGYLLLKDLGFSGNEAFEAPIDAALPIPAEQPQPVAP